MAGVAIAYSFWLATESYKGARDVLNDSMRRTETQFEELSVVEDYDTRSRSQIEKRSLFVLYRSPDDDDVRLVGPVRVTRDRVRLPLVESR